MYNSTKNQQKFTPTTLQIKWLHAASDCSVDPTITAIADAIDCDRSNWYKWNKDPEFVEWWNREWERVMCNSVWRLDKIGMRKASEDFRYWKALQEKYSNISEKRNESEDIEIQIVNRFRELQEQ